MLQAFHDSPAGVVVVFNNDLAVGPWNDCFDRFFIRWNNVERTPVNIDRSNPKHWLHVAYGGFNPQGGPNVITYDGACPGLVDQYGQPIPAFSQTILPSE